MIDLIFHYIMFVFVFLLTICQEPEWPIFVKLLNLVIRAAKGEACNANHRCDKDHGSCGKQGGVDTCYCDRGYKLSAIDSATCLGRCEV